MLRIVLPLRFCLLFFFSVLLIACGTQRPAPVKAVDISQAIIIPASKNCPPSLLGLKKQQEEGRFLNCHPDKDGTAFVDEQQTVLTVPEEHQGRWLLIDTKKQQLEVKHGKKTLQVFANISIGRNGAGIKQHRGDDITPVGEYRIGWINDQSQFHTFYGLTYPSLENAKEGFKKGLISDHEYEAIEYAHQFHLIPPQNTALGGQIGIHGLGAGDESVHDMLNWTHGCIALTNNQIEELDHWIVEGMLVRIQ